MKPYKSKSGKPSGVSAYEIGDTYITVSFHGEIYKYTYKTAGLDTIEQMKALAINQQGLSSFISQKQPEFE